MNLQFANFQRCKHAVHQHQAVNLQLALCLLLLMILQLYHLPPPLSPTVNNSLCLLTRCQHLYASCCTVLTVLFKVSCCKILNIFFISCLFFYVLCEKYYEFITLQYYTANYVSRAPRLTLLDLQTT